MVYNSFFDGNRNNNDRKNLEAICPNCHSLTETWRGRNKKTAVKISEEDYKKALLKHTSIRAALEELGIAAKGSNYTRAKRILTELGIEYKYPTGANNKNAKITWEELEEAKQLRLNGMTFNELGKKYNMHPKTISKALRGISYKK